MARSPASSEGKPGPEGTEGFPEHGASAEPELPLGDPAPKEPEKPDLLADIRKQVDRLERDNQELRKSIPRPPSSPAQQDEEDDVDWEKELFANPKAAMTKAMAMATQRAEKNIRAEVQRDSGTRDFWNEFYRKNNDLRDDHDLVEVILNKNLPELSDLPIDKGYERLAELTRDRIMRYMNAPKGGRKATAEGASAIPGEPKVRKVPEEAKIKSLSDILKERRQRRRGQAA